MTVFARDRVELAALSGSETLRPAEARHISPVFGAGDLSGAVMCFRRLSSDQPLVLQARRHPAADQIEAQVQRTDLATVVTALGQTLTRVNLTLRVGSRRHLQAYLPPGATLWSLAVDGQAAQPSLPQTTGRETALLIPLPQQAAEEVLVELVYVEALPVRGNWSGEHHLKGPRFDLPLQQITWSVYVPEGYRYHDFSGSLTWEPGRSDETAVQRYNLHSYEQQILQTSRRHDQLAQQQQDLARELSQQGQQAAARRALAKGYNYSLGNAALNEDIRVDLENLLRQQAKAGLVNARDRFRQQANAAPQMDSPLVQQQVQSVENTLAQADNENLELITRRIIQTQQDAVESVAQLHISLSPYGRLLRFKSPLQVESAAAMDVRFKVQSMRWVGQGRDLWGALGCGLGLILVWYGWRCGAVYGMAACNRWLKPQDNGVDEGKKSVDNDLISAPELL